MYSFARGLWLSVGCILQLLYRVSAGIDITYPIAGTNYTSGPYQIQWTSNNGDPSNITIYLATYNSSDVITNELRCITWDTSSGSTYISMTEEPPKGNSWTWMFYDSSEPLNLDQNEIAESAHFIFSGSLLPTAPGNTTSNPHHSISAGAAGAIGVVLTLVVVAICLLAYIFFYRKRQRIAKDHVVDHRPEKGHYKPELEGRNDGNVASRTQPLEYQDMHAPAVPLPESSNRGELSAFAQHELYGDTRGYCNSEMPTHANTSQIPSFELATHSTQNSVPTIKRKKVGVAGQ